MLTPSKGAISFRIIVRSVLPEQPMKLLWGPNLSKPIETKSTIGFPLLFASSFSSILEIISFVEDKP